MIKTVMKKCSGQVVIILLLVTVIVLAVGLSVAGRSINEIETSTISENSSRAFSAAEAGLERIITKIGTGNYNFTDLSNDATSSASYKTTLPDPGQAIEYGSLINKDSNSVAQFWLADPSSIDPSGNGLPTHVFVAGSFNLYFGDANGDYTNKPTDKPAVEVSVISYNNANHNIEINKFYVDTDNGSRNTDNGFTQCGLLNPASINTTMGQGRSFYCKSMIAGYPQNYYVTGNYPILVRIRILYSSLAHPVALSGGSNFPPQVSQYTSEGSSGNTKRMIQVTKHKEVLPFFFDFALYATGNISK